MRRSNSLEAHWSPGWFLDPGFIIDYYCIHISEPQAASSPNGNTKSQHSSINTTGLAKAIELSKDE